MNTRSNDIFDEYCYGPVDIMSLRKGSSTMWLQLQDVLGRKALATYRGCVYWSLDTEQIGMHLPLVCKVSAQQLLTHSSPSLMLLRRNSSDIKSLLTDWEKDGLNFYVHYGPSKDQEFLVVASSKQYEELM